MPETDSDTPTQLLPLVQPGESAAETAVPVFVDPSGRRRRVARRLATGALLAAVCYALMVLWSLLGGPVSPNALIPFSAPHAAASNARPTHVTQPSPAAGAGVPAGIGASTGAGGTGATTASSGSSSTASPSASAKSNGSSGSSPGHKPTSAPGKPTTQPTKGRGH